MLPNPAGGLHSLYMAFISEGIRKVVKGFVIDKLPETFVFGSVFFGIMFLDIVFCNATFQIACRADIKPARWILQDIHIECARLFFQAPRVGLEPTT